MTKNTFIPIHFINKPLIYKFLLIISYVCCIVSTTNILPAQTVKTVKTRAKKIKDELEDVVDELQDVVQAFKGKPTKSKLNSLTKQQLIDAAKQDHGTDFDLTVKKSTLVNKVYSLYNKK